MEPKLSVDVLLEDPLMGSQILDGICERLMFNSRDSASQATLELVQYMVPMALWAETRLFCQVKYALVVKDGVGSYMRHVPVSA